MNNLPDDTQIRANNTPPGTNNTASQTAPSAGGAFLKEVERPSAVSSEVSIRPATAETELPKEVASAGVTLRPTSVPIPPKLSQMGVKPAGNNVPTQPKATTVALPLTDDQIAQGLHQGIMSSWRWLAQWCLRRLKQLHVGLKAMHGKLTRVRA
ncbi:hypothetical protein KKB64_04815 [Patescibacteria group bacterium]|nr:hypothetical protein [Patescibacteria group bacterium]MBU1473073.1 hypothetical protein [Patescibacteria group bacterium]MBU2460171.1 hypothetical protein [Patescibacteria group bacterium]MBU2544487.1 hypothetical protein [Patescibacteria group bacterium]